MKSTGFVNAAFRAARSRTPQSARALLGLLASAFAVASHSAIIVYGGVMSGAAESPANNSAGTGTATVTVDTVAHTMRVQTTFSGLSGTTTAAHIHCCTAVALTSTAGVATTTPTFANFPLGVTAGTYDNTLDLTQASSYNPAFVTANGGTPATAEAALLAGMAANTSYLNIHSSVVGGGEIRTFLTAQVAPTFSKAFEPSSAPFGSPVSLLLTIVNPASNALPATGISFNDTLPSGMTAALSGGTSDCGGTLVTTANAISLAGATLAAGAQCTVSVPVTVISEGSFVNTTEALASSLGTGGAATATILIGSAPLIPTLNPWLTAVLAALVAIGAFAYARRRRA